MKLLLAESVNKLSDSACNRVSRVLSGRCVAAQMGSEQGVHLVGSF